LLLHQLALPLRLPRLPHPPLLLVLVLVLPPLLPPQPPQPLQPRPNPRTCSLPLLKQQPAPVKEHILREEQEMSRVWRS